MPGRLLFKIVRAWWYFFSGKNSYLMQRRLVICEPCELRKWKVCSECGCPLFAKASDPEEHCPHPKGDKWKYKNTHPLRHQTIKRSTQDYDNNCERRE